MKERIHLIGITPHTIPFGACSRFVEQFWGDDNNGRLIGFVFNPECAPALELRDLRTGQNSLFKTVGAIPGALLTLRAERFTPHLIHNSAMLSAEIANVSDNHVIASGAFLCDLGDPELLEMQLRHENESHALKAEIDRLNQDLARLATELSRRLPVEKP